MHGWYPEEWELERPELLFYVTMGHLREMHYLVTTERQAAFLRSAGFSHVRPIGLPIVYVPPPGNVREPGSLLVMPAHSLPANDRARAAGAYVDAIAALRPCFETITICVGGHDWERGNWVTEFRAAGFEVIRGAGDDTSLDRMVDLFSRFEAVTTNGFGSLVAYGSALGAKVSCYGPFSNVTRDMVRNVPFFIDNPELIDLECHLSSETYCRERFPDLFCHPAEAPQRIEWGRTEIGHSNRLPPDDLRDVLGWSRAERVRSRLTRLAQATRSRVPAPVRDGLNDVLARDGRLSYVERWRLGRWPTGRPGVVPLFGERFAFVDAVGFIDEYDDWFVRQSYRFRSTSHSPFVVIANAGIGLGALYAVCLFPECRVLALEADPDRYAALERNCRVYGLDGARLVNGDLDCDDAVRALRPSTHGAPSDTAVARACDRIDFLRAELTGTSPRLSERMTALLQVSESVALDCVMTEDGAPDLTALFHSVESAGFRVIVQSRDTGLKEPLVRIASSGRHTTDLRILGYRA